MDKNSMDNKVIVIVGPTASGKSDLAIKLAKKYRGEIISADSRQVYRGMDIGTGKVLRDKTLPVPSLKFKVQSSKFYSEGIRHYLIDVASPKKVFTADDYKKLGQEALKEILAKGKIPIIVGGTGFYIDVLLDRVALPEVPPDKDLRTKLERQSVEQLLKRLRKLDPERAQTIDPRNKRRIVRALEIVLGTGKPVPRFKIYDSGFKNKYKILWIGLKPKDLEKKIKIRLDERLKQGMIKEVQALHQKGVNWKRLESLGLEYRYISRWLIKNQKSKIKNQNYNSKFKNSEEYQILLREIIKYSKRQMTWFKRNEEIHWVASRKNISFNFSA